MIQALLVDDERLALLKLQMMLEELTTIQVIAAYTDPTEAVRAAPQLSPDVIFLDIDMPEMNGIQAAEAMLKLCPQASIVFVTAYNHYAVEAFELYALDYILKPVQRSRLLMTVQRLEERVSQAQQAAEKPLDAVMIRSFQSLRFERSGQTLPGIRWRTSKAQELFAYLFHNRNRFVSKDTLTDLLWPDFNEKKASTHLYTTIYQVRQSLKQAELGLQISNVSGGEGYTLETGSVLVDSYEWEKGILTLDAINADNYEEHQRLFEFYSGDYLSDYDYLWAEGERQRLRTIWLHHAMGIAEFYISSGRIPEALTVYQRVVQLQPFFEQGHLGLMKVYDSIGERSAVEDQYYILTDLLRRELNVEPPANIKRWFNEWKHQNLRSL
ncbi:response regulator [Paenibacillus piscarius]|uniref:response regulator n=1 Tax=Paenibacillus piscarius TaxID=1089681 RepID=UPI001EE8F214|nr:response regulator [Paenibacillus piscarius]